MLFPSQKSALHHCGEPISLLKVICKEILCGISIAVYQGIEGQSIIETDGQNLLEELT